MVGKYWSCYNCSASGRAHLSTAASTVWICACKSTNGGLQKAAACSCSRPGGYGELAATPLVTVGSIVQLHRLIVYSNTAHLPVSRSAPQVTLPASCDVSPLHNLIKRFLCLGPRGGWPGLARVTTTQKPVELWCQGIDRNVYSSGINLNSLSRKYVDILN